MSPLHDEKLMMGLLLRGASDPADLLPILAHETKLRDERHRCIVAAARTVFDEAGKLPTFTEVLEELDRRGCLARAGGTEYLVALKADAEGAGPGASYYLLNSSREARSEALRHAGDALSQLAIEFELSHAEIQKRIDAALEPLFEGAPDLLPQPTSIKSLVMPLARRLEKEGRGPDAPIRTDIGDDDRFAHLGGTVVVSGPRGIGRTTLAVQIADATSTPEHPVLFVSMDDCSPLLAERVVSRHSGIEVARLCSSQLDHDDYAPLSRAVGQLSSTKPLYLCGPVPPAVSLLVATIRRSVADWKVKTAIVDGLERALRDDNDAAHRVRLLRGLALQLDVNLVLSMATGDGSTLSDRFLACTPVDGAIALGPAHVGDRVWAQVRGRNGSRTDWCLDVDLRTGTMTLAPHGELTDDEDDDDDDCPF